MSDTSQQQGDHITPDSMNREAPAPGGLPQDRVLEAWAAEEGLSQSENRLDAVLRMRTLEMAATAAQLNLVSLTVVPPAFPAGLQRLDVSNDQLTYLPEFLPTGLQELYAGLNWLTRLPSLPPGLRRLDVAANQGTSLPETPPPGLQILHVEDNHAPLISDHRNGQLSELQLSPPVADDIRQAALVGWERKKMEELPAGTKFNHANRDGVWGGSGQSGHTGEAIWMTSENDVNAARGYAGCSGKYFVIEAQKPLKLAVMDERCDQVEHDELGAWVTVAQKYGLDGVKTENGSSYEVVLFDRSKIAPAAERGLGLREPLPQI
ncbi:hypothetical protein ABIB80_007814 [Bradyrhizobium sp. i1.15.2]|uniref:hypothetical protein n=1 Tax=Bradyrhizobium sp. i1.15.2 TaxID=3156362 RepID=UPI003395645E